MSGHSASFKAILYAFFANFGLAIAKTAASIYTGSGSMMAEAIHSYADCTNQLLLFLGLKQSQKPATVEHPFGFGKVTYFWSFIVAIMLFSMGGLYSVFEGYHKLHVTEPLSQAWVALLVLAVGILLEGFSLAGALREIKNLRGEDSFWKWFRDTRNAELVVILGEDTAAILGLAIAFVFVSLASVTGNPIYDAIGSICIGVVLLFVSVFIAIRVMKLIIGKSAEPELEALLNSVIDNDDSIEKILNTMTMHFGPYVMLAAKVKMKNGLSIEETVKHINDLEVEIERSAPIVKWTFIEPDITD